MWTLIRFVNRHATTAMASSVIIGLAVPALAAALYPYIAPMVLVIVAVSLMQLDWRLVLMHIQRPTLPGLGILWTLVGVPLIVWAIARWFGVSEIVGTSLMLNALTPPMIASPALALILGLDAELSMVVTLAGTVAFPAVLAAVVALGVLGPAYTAGMTELTIRLAVMIGLPLILCAIAHLVFGRRRIAAAAQPCQFVVVVTLVVIVVGIMHGANLTIRGDLGQAIELLVASALFNLAVFFATIAVFWRLGRLQQLALAIVSANRNMGLTLAVTLTVAGPQFAAYVAFGQLPIYLTPVLLKRWIDRHARKGPAAGSHHRPS